MSEGLIDPWGAYDLRVWVACGVPGGEELGLAHLAQATGGCCKIQMKPSGKHVYPSFWAYYPLYGYKPRSQKVYFDK